MGRKNECLVMQGGGPMANPDFGKHPQAYEVMMGGAILTGGKQMSARKNGRKSPSKNVRKSVRKNSRKSARKIVRKSPARPVQKNVRKSRPARGCTVQMTKK